ncbi:MAG: sporulation protein YqfD [Frisingicoccus sp.]
MLFREGEIVSMVTRSGVPKVTIGNTVRKGELLIDGVMEILDESMAVAESIPVGADGDIRAKVTENYSKTIRHLRKAELWPGCLEIYPVHWRTHDNLWKKSL